MAREKHIIPLKVMWSVPERRKVWSVGHLKSQAGSGLVLLDVRGRLKLVHFKWFGMIIGTLKFVCKFGYNIKRYITRYSSFCTN